MIRIAICDDDVLQCDIFNEMIEVYAQNKSSEIQTNVFYSGKELLEYVNKNSGFDVYFLDLIMEEMNGIEVAQALRSNADKGKIVFLTSTPDYVFNAFAVKASDYILKPISPERLSEVLDGICKEIQEENPVGITVRSLNGDNYILLNDVVYIENVNRAPIYYLNDGKTIKGISSREKFTSMIEPFLKENKFALCNIGIAVNLSYVASLKGNDVFLKNGNSFTCTRTMCKEFKRILNDFWNN